MDAVDSQPGDGVCATSGGQCTLRAAVMEAGQLEGPDTIELPPGSYLLTPSEGSGVAAETGDLAEVEAPAVVEAEEVPMETALKSGRTTGIL